MDYEDSESMQGDNKFLTDLSFDNLFHLYTDDLFNRIETIKSMWELYEFEGIEQEINDIMYNLYQLKELIKRRKKYDI